MVVAVVAQAVWLSCPPSPAPKTLACRFRQPSTGLGAAALGIQPVHAVAGGVGSGSRAPAPPAAALGAPSPSCIPSASTAGLHQQPSRPPAHWGSLVLLTPLTWAGGWQGSWEGNWDGSERKGQVGGSNRVT